MAQINDIGARHYYQWPIFWLSDNPPLVEITSTQETDAPYRRGKCAVLRIPFTKRAFVLGRWLGTLDEEAALLSAIGGRVTQDNGVSINEIEGL